MHDYALTRRTMLGSMAALTLAGQASATATAVAAKPLPGTPQLVLGSAFDPAAVHYSVAEFTLAGTAKSYKVLSPPDAQARWHVATANTAPYVTRIVVIRPTEAAAFNGTVLVEWLNVSGGFDYPPLWSTARREIVRSGAAYVAVSAQHVGVEGGKTVFGMDAKGLKQTDPSRYGSLSDCLKSPIIVKNLESIAGV